MIKIANAVLLVALVQFSPQARGARIVKTPSADASLIEVAPTNNNGGEAWVLSGRTQNGPRTRALVRFDFSDLPTNAIIQSVTLTLEVTRVPDEPPVNSAFGLHRVLRAWGEGSKATGGLTSPGRGLPASAGEVTWAFAFFPTNTWTAPGGAPDADFSSTESSFQFVTGLGTYRFESTPEIVGDVQGWVANAESNHGWMLLCGNEDVPFTARRFGARESDVPPLLELEYLVPPNIDSVERISNEFRLLFTAEAGQAYVVEFRDALSSGAWQTYMDIPSSPSRTVVTVVDWPVQAQRLYRIRLK